MKRNLRRFLAAVCTAAVLLTSASALTVEQAVELLEENYIDDLPVGVYAAETLDEVFAALGDPYTYYMSAEDYAAFYASVEDTSSLVGVGVGIQYSERGIEVVQVINGGPAEAAGLSVGDIIVAVDGVSCVPGTEDASAQIMGEEGTTVVLTVLHADGNAEDYPIVRALVVVNNTNLSVREEHVGVFECTSFGSETAVLIRGGIEAHEGEVDTWWMDLRGNSGGRSDVAVDAISLFGGAGAHLYYRSGDGTYYMEYAEEDYITEHPVIVLTDSYSASASELFAAGIRDCTAGIVVGSRTFGKGVAQIILDGENTEGYFTDDALKVTAYRVFSSNYNTTDKVGIFPTLLVESELADEVALLLGTKAPEDSAGWLKIGLGGWAWYVELERAQSAEQAEYFDRLLEAIPSDAPVYMGTGGGNWIRIPDGTVLTLYGKEAESRCFTDVQESEYAEQLNALATYGVLRGSGDGSFNPNGTLTRAELCAMLCQCLNVTSTSESVFSDVPTKSWYAPYVMAANQLGLMKGYGNGNFGPHAKVTNEEFITVMGRLAEFLNAALYNSAESFTKEALADERLDGYKNWARESARLMLYTEDMYEDGRAAVMYDRMENIDPKTLVLREQAGAAICNLLRVTGILFY